MAEAVAISSEPVISIVEGWGFLVLSLSSHTFTESLWVCADYICICFSTRPFTLGRSPAWNPDGRSAQGPTVLTTAERKIIANLNRKLEQSIQFDLASRTDPALKTWTSFS